MKKRLWITYAWADNKDADFDFLVKEIEKRGIEVAIDKKVTIAGQPLWDRIFLAISDTNLDAWALYLTSKSLNSEACREELAAALDRALTQGRQNFPLIGIFPGDVSRDLIPTPIRTRKYVHLSDPRALDQILEGVSGKLADNDGPELLPISIRYRHEIGFWEFWPRIGSLSEPYALVPISQFAQSPDITPYSNDVSLMLGSRGGSPNGFSMGVRKLFLRDKSLNGTQIAGVVSYGGSAFVRVPDTVSEMFVGGLDGMGREVTCRFSLEFFRNQQS